MAKRADDKAPVPSLCPLDGINVPIHWRAAVVTVPSRERRVPLKRVSPYVAATCLLTSLLFLIVSAIPVYADANPNNHGHHYGQLKHPKNPPVPIPSSNLASTPAPHSHPATVPVAQGADPAPGQLLAVSCQQPCSRHQGARGQDAERVSRSHAGPSVVAADHDPAVVVRGLAHRLQACDARGGAWIQAGGPGGNRGGGGLAATRNRVASHKQKSDREGEREHGRAEVHDWPGLEGQADDHGPENENAA